MEVRSIPIEYAMNSPENGPSSEDRSIYLKLTLFLQLLLTIGLVLFVRRRDWENVFLTALIIVITLWPAVLSRRYRVYVPPEFQFIAAAFVFLSLFLGSAADYYYKYWWWDIVLHTGSGFLLGIIGFLALFLLNRTSKLPAGMSPAFLCFFGVTFAVFLGVIWEIFEFVVDGIAPAVNMQSNETGVVDTMQDLIVDTLGAVIVAVMGWIYTKTGRYSFIADGLRKFVAHNPRFFHRRDPSEGDIDGTR
jgi:VanZ family protein